jgi:hypothetical protein
MAQVPRCERLFRKAKSALLASIEIYNKPDFRYREETFAILAMNAWELLLKARLLKDARNEPRCLYLYQHRKTKSGQPSKKRYIKLSRSGNPQTISIGGAMTALDKVPGAELPSAVKENLDALGEIRDNAVHYMNAHPQLAKHVLEIGTAAVRNFIELARVWFDEDFSSYNLYLMPIGFVTAPGTATAISTSPDEDRLVKYLAQLIENDRVRPADGYHVALEVSLSFKKSVADAVTTVAITNDPNAPKVTLSEENIRQKYPWEYRELVQRCRERYTDFKENESFHVVRRPLTKDPRYVHARYLDPGNLRSGKKDFYNANILTEFDKHYRRRR